MSSMYRSQCASMDSGSEVEEEVEAVMREVVDGNRYNGCAQGMVGDEG